MLKFVLDEDILRSTGIILEDNGYDILDIRLSNFEIDQLSILHHLK